MTVDPTCPSRETRKVVWPPAGAVESPAGARRRDRWEPRSMPVQRVGRAMVDASTAAVEDASLATSRWCWSRDYRRRATSGCPYCCFHCCCRSHRSRCSFLFPSPCPCPCMCRHYWCWEQEGEGLPGDMVAPAMVDVEAAVATEGAE
jgi:hypothetical protein